ncbi:MAG: hypothetical protein BroJett011_76010 [Chloroflexota bacterium]|nr:MAG: hypothetical protein BroJett011_76010 [Chloroflexota bacterium]
MSQQADKKTLIRNRSRRLQKLKEQQALAGIYTDPKILIEIEEIEAEIEILRAQLDEIPENQALVKPLNTSIACLKYLERLQSQILEVFRQDRYVMLTVEALELEDPSTLFALQQALRASFDLRVEVDIRGGGISYLLKEVITLHRLATLLGDPGIGKTTSLRFIALQQIEKFRTQPDQLLPVWVSLGKWADKKTSAEDFIWSEFAEILDSQDITPITFQDWLVKGKLLILADGLNELPQRELENSDTSSSKMTSQDEQSKKIIDPRENDLMVLARESRSQFVLSCRILEYTHLLGWREFRVLPLTDDQIMEFVQRHLGRLSQRFDAILEQQPELKNLIRTPFFLRSLVQLIQENWHIVPTDRFQLVQYTCQAALHREARRRNLEADLVVGTLGEMSFKFMERGWIGSWSDKQASSANYREVMECATGAGLVIRAAEDESQLVYRYLHQLVQEALALSYLQSWFFKDYDYREVRALARTGEIYLERGKLKDAQENFQQALKLCPTVEAKELRASILLNLGRVYRLWRRTKQGREYTETATQLLEQVGGDTNQLAETYHELGTEYEHLREMKKAEKYYHLSLEVYERLGNQSDYAYEILFGLADFYSDVEVYQISKALSWYQKALNIFEKEGDDLGVTRCKLEIARTLYLWGEMNKADELFRSCAKEFERLEKPWFQVDALRWLGHIFRDTKNFSEAIPIYERALKLAEQERFLGYQYMIMLYGLAWATSLQGNYFQANDLSVKALKIAKSIANPFYLADAYGGLGFLAWRAKDFPKAIEYLLECDKNMDYEYWLHLDLPQRLSIMGARTFRKYTSIQPLAKLASLVLRQIYSLYEWLRNPANKLGRQVFRFNWWLRRF